MKADTKSIHRPHPDNYSYGEEIPHGTRVQCYFLPFSGEVGTVHRYKDERLRISCRMFVVVDGFPCSVFYPSVTQLRRIRPNNKRKQKAPIQEPATCDQCNRILEAGEVSFEEWKSTPLLCKECRKKQDDTDQAPEPCDCDGKDKRIAELRKEFNRMEDAWRKELEGFVTGNPIENRSVNAHLIAENRTLKQRIAELEEALEQIATTQVLCGSHYSRTLKLVRNIAKEALEEGNDK